MRKLDLASPATRASFLALLLSIRQGFNKRVDFFAGVVEVW